MVPRTVVEARIALAMSLLVASMVEVLFSGFVKVNCAVSEEDVVDGVLVVKTNTVLFSDEAVLTMTEDEEEPANEDKVEEEMD